MTTAHQHHRATLTIAERLAAVAAGVGADALNLRIHVPGVAPDVARDQITRLGATVEPLHSALR